MKFTLATTSLLCSFLLYNTTTAGSTIAPQLASQLQRLSPHDEVLVWVFFTDKGSHELKKSAVPRDVVSPRSFLRRLKMRSVETAVDYTDLQVERSYVEQIAGRVIHVRHISKWFNGVSVRTTRAQIEGIAQLPFVSRIETLTRMKRNLSEQEEPTSQGPARNSHFATVNSLDYGMSSNQMNMLNIPAVHSTGNYGQDVVIGIMDNGFRLMNHESFDTLRPRILATYDFVDYKVSVEPNNRDPGFGSHGIYILSALGGYKPGEVIGPAFRANYVLARTENDSSETPFEEDKWVAAVEWMDSIGVHITSTSLGYLDYDLPHRSWTWEDMNGNTTLITRAADMAVSKGIVVVNSAGNNGFNATRNTLNAPADGDSVLSIGALTTDGQRSGSSSVGPTTSVPPRIKPDVMAQGVSVRCASPTDPRGYTYSGGTSLACPLVAGVAALILSARPNLTPIEVGNALRQTASNANSPNNLIGWGTVNAMRAINFVTGGSEIPTTFRVSKWGPNPFNPSTNISFDYSSPQPARITLKIVNVLGQEVRTLALETVTISVPRMQWDGRNNAGDVLPSGAYFAQFIAAPLSGGTQYRETVPLIFLK